jgi:hypothetical protein
VRLRTLLIVALPPVAVTCAVLAFYAFHFGVSNGFSGAQAWGAFGSYFGGTLGPLLAYAALIAVLLNLRTQEKALALSKETASRQSEYLQRKERKDEWRDAIRDADRLLQEHLKIPVIGKNGTIADLGGLLQQVSAEVRQAQKFQDKGYADTIFAKYTPKLNTAAFDGTATLVWDIWNLLDGFAENLTEKDSRLLSFYISYFQGVTTQLHVIGALGAEGWKMVGKVMQKTFSGPSVQGAQE